MRAEVEVPPGARIGAAVDVGANSVHLLVAAVRGHELLPLADESVFLGLGDRVATDGYLGTELRRELVDALARYAQTARALGADEVTFVGTEPIRRAADAATLVHEVEARTGITLHVLDHHEEGILNLLGVTLGYPLGHEIVVADIGGGSSEIILAGPGRRTSTEGLRVGCARLTQDFVRGDPPTDAEIEAMRQEARRIVAGLPDAAPTELIAVGGTASNLLRVLPPSAVDRTLSRRRIAVANAILMVQTSAEAAERHLLREMRARLLPAGAVIADAILERYGADRMRVSEQGLREGLVLATIVAGPSWRDRLESLAAGWRD
jgi:exopolyphosphatase/pppGpp-phosphohydrolase